jgi:Family of unknown function (DUF5681)
MNDKPQNGPGRLPPPVKHRFLKGSSGNKRGRPKGSIDLKKLTRKVALKKHRIVVNGRAVRKTLLQLVIETVVRGAASGAPSMVSLHTEIRAKVRPMEEMQHCGLLVVPEGLLLRNGRLRKKHVLPTPRTPQPTSIIKARNSARLYRAFRRPLAKRYWQATVAGIRLAIEHKRK